jgi:hypothetical protein
MRDGSYIANNNIEANVLEAEFQRNVLAFLRKNEIEHWRMPIGPVLKKGGSWAHNPLKGFPDIMGLLKTQNGRAWALELKTPTGRLSPEQAGWLVRLKDAGAAVAVVTNMVELQKFFRSLGELP